MRLSANPVPDRALILSAGALFSRLLGLVRDLLFAFILGGGWAGDLFLAAFRLPHFVRRLLQEGAVSLAFIPFFVREDAERGRQSALNLGRSALLSLCLLSLVPALAGVMAAGPLALAFLPGLAHDRELSSQAASLLRLGFFYLPPAAAAAGGVSILLALGSYAAPACAPLALNLGLLGAGLAAIFLGQSGWEAAMTLCLGFILGGCLQFILQLPPLYGRGFRLRGSCRIREPAHLNFLRSLPPSLCGAAAQQLHFLAGTLLASFLGQGSISALYYAERLVELPLALVGAPLGMASLAGFSALVLAGARPALLEETRRLTGLALFLTLPAAVGLMVFAAPIVRLLFMRGAFDPAAAALTGAALLLYAPVLPAAAAGRPLLAALNAQGQRRAAAASAIISLACLILAAPLLMAAWGLPGLALGESLAAWLNLALLTRALRHGLGNPETPGAISGGLFPWDAFGRALLLSLTMLGAALGLEAWTKYLGLGGGQRLALIIPLAAGIYFTLAALTRNPELRMILDRK
ncbi:MAG: murein biosynthesis integral membrane protein MurJ [Desulfovibrionaceae bacterium]|nr:murein biosynthesis integral membrane protein MurJ [Desulfovibrionaceae bacterium]